MPAKKPKKSVRRPGAKLPTSLFDHPDAEKALARALELLVIESDRGAVIVGMDMVDAALEELFKAIFPASLKGEDRRQLFEYPGALSSVASKAKIAVATRMIERALFDAITALRKLRNQVAHSTAAFRLEDHRQQLTRVLTLGPNVPVGVNRLACELLVSNATQHMRGITLTINDKEVVPIATNQSALEWLKRNKKVLDVLNERRHRCELAIGIGIICALLILGRDVIAAKFSGNTLITK